MRLPSSFTASAVARAKAGSTGPGSYPSVLRAFSQEKYIGIRASLTSSAFAKPAFAAASATGYGTRMPRPRPAGEVGDRRRRAPRAEGSTPPRRYRSPRLAALERECVAPRDVADVDDVEPGRADVGRGSGRVATPSIMRPVGVGFESPSPTGVVGLTTTAPGGAGRGARPRASSACTGRRAPTPAARPLPWRSCQAQGRMSRPCS